MKKAEHIHSLILAIALLLNGCASAKLSVEVEVYKDEVGREQKLNGLLKEVESITDRAVKNTRELQTIANDIIQAHPKIRGHIR